MVLVSGRPWGEVLEEWAGFVGVCLACKAGGDGRGGGWRAETERALRSVGVTFAVEVDKATVVTAAVEGAA